MNNSSRSGRPFPIRCLVISIIMAMAESRNALPRLKAGKLALATFQEPLRISPHDLFLFIGVKIFASRSGMGGVLRVWDDSDILYDGGRGLIHCPDRENRVRDLAPYGVQESAMRSEDRPGSPLNS